MKKFSLLTTIFFTFLFTVSLALAAVPKLVPYQGVLYDEQAAKPLNGVYSITFEIYDVPNGGTPVWTVNRSVNVENGYFSIMLGEVNPLSNVNFNKQLYLQVTVANGTPYPRTKLGATPYAIQAISAVDADTAKVAQNVVDGALTWQKFNPAAIVAGGDLQGNYPAPTLRKGVVLENIEPGSITQKYLAPNVSVPPAGKAGGDLAGQFPDPLIAKGAVKTDRLADGAVTLEKMANNSVSSANIIDGEVYLVDLNNEVKEMGGDLDGFLPNPTVVGFQNIPVSPMTALHGQVYMLYQPNQDADPIWVAMNAAGDVAGTWDNLQIQEGVVTTLEIADNTIMDVDVNANAAIKGTKIHPDFGFQDVITTGDVYADNAYITNDIYATNIYAADQLGAMNGTFDNLTVNLSTLLNGAVEINSNAVINGTITGVNNFVLDGEPLTAGDLDGFYPFPIIRENAVTTIKILNGAVTNPKLGPDAVTTDKILNTTILEEDIADGQISTRTLAAGAVTNNIIAPDAVTSDKILDGTIVSADIADGTIQTIDIGDGQITTAKLAAGAVTNNIIANDAVTSNKIMNGTIIDEDVNAAAGIQGTKINPDFGNQLVTTTGEVNANIVTANTTFQSYGSILNPGPGAVLVDDDMNVTGNLTVGGTINLQNVNAINVTAQNGYFDNLWVYFGADIQGPIQNSIGSVLVQDDLDVTGYVSSMGPIFSAASVSAPIISGNDADFTNLLVYNNSDLQGSIINSTGNVVVSDNLDVTGAITGANATLTGNLVANDAILAGDLFANDGTFTGNVGVAGDVTATNFFGNLTGDVTADNILTNTITGTTGTFTTLNSTNFVGGAFTGTNGTFSGTLTAPTGNITTVNATTVNATAFQGGTFDGTTGNFTTSVTTPVGNIATVNATDVYATDFFGGAFTGTNGTFSGNVGVTGNVTANNGTFAGTVSAAQLNGTLQYGVLAGNGLLGGTFNNNANSTFLVDEAYAFNWTGNQTWAGTSTFNNGLNVNGTTMLNDDVVIGDAVTDVVTINGITTVQGIIGGGYDFTVDGDVDINGDANVDGTLTVTTLNPFDLNVLNDLTVANNSTLGNDPADWTLINGTMNFANLLTPTIMFDGNASVGILTDGANNALFLDGANAQFFAAGPTESVVIDGAAGTVTASTGATLGDDETVDLVSVRAATNILGNVTIGSIAPPYGYQTLVQNDGSNTALSVTGALTSATIPAFDVNGDAYIANAGTFDNPSLDADLYTYGNLEVDGNVYLGDAATDMINVTGIATFTGTGEFISGDANWTLRAENTNAGRAAQFVNNANSTTPGVEILNYGTTPGTMGLRIYNMAAGFGDQLLNVNSQVSNTASAAWFESMNTNLTQYAVGIRNTGDAPSLYADNQGIGRAALFANTTNSTSPVVEIINYSNNAGAIGLKIQNDNSATNFDDQLLNVVVSGTNTKASAAWFEANNSDPNEYAVGIRNVGTSASLYVDNQDVSGTADALYVNGHIRQGLNGRTVLGFSQVAAFANLATATGTVIEYSDAASVVLNSITDFPNVASGTVDGRVIYIVNNTALMMTVNNLSGFTATVNIQAGNMVGFIYVTDTSLLGSGWRLLNN